MAQIPGLTAGQYYQPGAGGAGYSMNVPRDWSQGGKQYYDPQYAVQLPQQQPSTAYYANTQGGAGSQYHQPATTPKPTQQPATGGYSPNIQTGITVGGVLPQQQVQQTQQRLRNTQMTAPPQDGGQNYAPFMQHLNSLLSNGGNAAAIDYGRDASFANAQQLLGSQQAQSRAGTGWGGVALQQHGNNLGVQQQGLSMLLSLLGQFGV